MSKSKHSEAQIIAALKQVEAGRAVEDLAREYSVSKHTIYSWKAKYERSHAAAASGRRKRPSEEAGGEVCLDREMLKALLIKNGLSS